MASDVMDGEAPGLQPGTVLWLRRLDADAARWSPELLDEDDAGAVADESRMVFLIDNPHGRRGISNSR